MERQDAQRQAVKDLNGRRACVPPMAPRSVGDGVDLVQLGRFSEIVLDSCRNHTSDRIHDDFLIGVEG
jgi:hypothetical protein